jgi:DNA helicase-2/ATP-dependent DNA helicase PcrA
MELLAELNPQQKQAVSAGLGPVLVLAGPGSGKTRVLTRRIAYLVGNMGVKPYNILAVTFTNKAAREMESRVETILGGSLQGLTIGTFHGACAGILRREAQYLPITNSFVIFDADDQETIIKHAIRDLNADEKLYRPNSVHSAISRAKNELILADSYPIQTYKDEVIKRVYIRYQNALVANNAVDFDDLLLYTAKLMIENPVVREKYASRYEHVLVDEFQDTNLAQYTILKQISSLHKNIFAVGDEDQSIYRWRGADYRNIQRFEKDYPGFRKILLEQNYRSNQNILDAARAVIDCNPHRTTKNLFTDRGEGEKITLYDAQDDRAEAQYVVESISRLTRSNGIKSSDCAVLYRTNAQSRLLEEAFLHAGQPYKLVGAQRFYGRREVKDIIAYLRVIHNPADDISMARVINTPPRSIGEKTVQQLQQTAQQANTSMGDVLMNLADGPESQFWPAFAPSTANKLADFGSRLVDWRSLNAQITLPTLFSRILKDIDYKGYIDDESEEGEDRWENVEELLRLAYEFEEKGLPDFLENLALVSDQDTIPDSVNATTLMTLHAAKGLEFPIVFITGLDEKILPHSRSLDEPEEMEEERRLFYVGMTRAKDRLYLVRADMRTGYGSFSDADPSRFLKDIPDRLLEHPQSVRPTLRHYSHETSWNAPQQVPTWRGSQGKVQNSVPIVKQRYQANMHVIHPVWGEGLVMESKIMDGDEILDVTFDSVGFKRLAASLANLEIFEK